MNLTAASTVLVQGIYQPLATYHIARMLAYGTNIVAGVSAGQGGKQIQGIPVFDLVEQACDQVGEIEATIIFVESYGALDAALEAIEAGIRQIIIISDGIPPLDTIRLLRKAEATNTLVVGPKSSGIIVPGKVLLGTQDSKFYTPGKIAMISRTSTLTYEVALALTQAGLGQSISVNLGSDAIIGSSFRHWLPILANYQETEAIVLVDCTGGGSEEETAQYINQAIDKPVITYVAGCNTPVDKQMGNASAIIAAQLSGPITSTTTAQHKVAAFKQAKIPVAGRPSQIPDMVKKALKKSVKS
ncbi:MAG: CoA-binding protein [Coleofasciculaceae cyanobacterium]